MAVTVQVTGGDAAKRYIDELSRKIEAGKVLRVGFLENAKYDGKPVALVAAVQNFGAPSRGIPPRPFFSNMVREKASEWGPVLAALLTANPDTARALDILGEDIAGQLRQSIVDTNEPELSPVTLLLRERFWGNPEDIKFADVQKARTDIRAGVEPNVTGTQAKPLVWTGHMLNSIGKEVQT